jgi:iron complex transport system permease protein
MLRLLGARDHRLLIPLSLLLGGAFLLIADTLARTLLAPQQLPVGVITALIGVPSFIAILKSTPSQ